MEAIDHEAETLLTKKTHHYKICLRLPDLEHAKAAVLNSLTSLDAQRGYRHAIDEFVDWYCSEPRLALNRIVVLRYRSHLESRQLAPAPSIYVSVPCAGLHTRPPTAVSSAPIWRLVFARKGVKKLGVRLGNWLTAERATLFGKHPIIND